MTAIDVDTPTRGTTAQQQDKDVTNAMELDTSQLYAKHVTQTATDKADTMHEGQATIDKVADLQVDLPVDHP